MFLAMCGAFFHISQFVLRLLLLFRLASPASSYVEESINLLILLSIPYCGWKGAKENDKSLLCWFCGCNLACSAYWPAMAILVEQHISSVESWCEFCG